MRKTSRPVDEWMSLVRSDHVDSLEDEEKEEEEDEEDEEDKEGEEEEKEGEEKKEEEGEEKKEEEEERVDKMVRLWKSEMTQGDCSININDPTSTCGPPRDLSDPSASGVTEVKQAPTVGTPDRHYRPLELAREKRRLRLAESQRS